MATFSNSSQEATRRENADVKDRDEGIAPAISEERSLTDAIRSQSIPDKIEKAAKRITSLQHPLVKHLVKLKKNSAYRREKQLLVIEGKKTVTEICQTHKASILLIEESQPIPPEIIADQILLTTREIVEKISSMKNPEGIIAEVPCPSFGSLTGKRLILALDQISDPGNMGTLIRTALALGWEGVFIFENSVDPFNDKAVSASRGAIFRLPLMKGTWDDLVTFSKTEGLEIFIADIHGEAIDKIDLPEKCILVLGNEAKGVVSPSARPYATISIPMPGDMESLNVAIAGAILMYLTKTKHSVLYEK